MKRPGRKFHEPKLTIPDSPALRGYLAGLLDGEGSIMWQDNRWIISIANTHHPVIIWLLTIGGKATERDRRPNKTCWHWRVHAQRDVLAFLDALIPYMIIKRDLAAVASEEIRGRLALYDSEQLKEYTVSDPEPVDEQVTEIRGGNRPSDYIEEDYDIMPWDLSDDEDDE